MSFKVLLVLTSQDRLGSSAVPAGTWLEELAAPYLVLAKAGCEVGFASIKGGAAPIDPASMADPWLTDNGKHLLADTTVMERLGTTTALNGIDAHHYDALFMIGGAAVMWDFPKDPTLGALLRDFAQSGRILGGVCHGVAGFLNPLAGHIVIGRRITCISDNEDKLAGYDQLVPFMPEGPLRAAGAQLSFAAEPFGSHAVRDGALITGENPASAGPCGELILEALRERSSKIQEKERVA
jgi:putative intracellular protease/amidase